MEQKPAVICFLFNLFLLRNFLDSSCRDVMKWGCWRTVHRESCSAQQEEIYYIMLCKGLAVFIWVDCSFFVCFLLSSSINSPKHCFFSVVAGPLWDSEQTLQGGPEEHRPGDESRDDGRRRAGEDAEQLPGGRLRGVTAGWRGGETQRPEEEGEGDRRTLSHNIFYF